MTLHNPEVPLVYSLHYVQQGCQDLENEVPLETKGRMKRQEKGRATSTLRRHFLRSWRVGTLTLVSVSSSRNTKRFLEHSPLPCIAKSWSRWTSNSSQSLQGL